MIHYTAAVLTASAQADLLATFQPPEGWSTFAHHMTIIYGQGLPAHLEGDAGEKVQLVATHIGKSDKAIAIKVSGYWSNNKIPHVTIAVDTANGGKPVDSNKIENWKAIKPLTLEGIVTEVQK